MKTIQSFEVELCGIDHSQYFQGRGVACTDWEDVAIGAADNAYDALADALEQLACGDWDTESVNWDEEEKRALCEGESVSGLQEAADNDPDAADADYSEHNYYVAVYVK